MEKQNKQLFLDFILNKCTPEELQKVCALMESGEYEQDWQDAMLEAESFFSGDALANNKLNEGRLYKKIHRSIFAKKANKLKFSLTYIAAAASLALIAAGIWMFSFNQISSPRLVQRNVNITKAKTGTAHKWIRLADGSSVQLNSNSELYYPHSFDGAPLREVVLIGEGFFDIAHDSKHPFVIRTGKIKTTVLGTAFNISAYDTASAVTVTVTRGKVRVEDEQHTLAILTPDQQLAWNDGAQAIKKNTINATEVLAWKETDLIMDNITLKEAGKLLTERYGVEVHFINDQVMSCRFIAAFLNRTDISQVIEVLSATTGATITLKNNVLTIGGKGC